MTWAQLAELLDEWAVQTLFRDDGTRVRQAYLPDLATPALDREVDQWLTGVIPQKEIPMPPDNLRYGVLPRLRYAALAARLKTMTERSGGFVPLKVSATAALHTLLIEDWHSMNRTAWMSEDMPDDFSFPN